MSTGKSSVCRAPWRFITLMGVVSPFSDMAHEGARSILGEYLNLAGVSCATIGFVSGVAELCGYSLRLLSGIFADKMKKYWTPRQSSTRKSPLYRTWWPSYHKSRHSDQGMIIRTTLSKWVMCSDLSFLLRILYKSPPAMNSAPFVRQVW